MNAPLPPDAVAVALLPVAAITASPTNPRKHFDDAYLAELAESIKAHGVIQPITVRPMSVDMKMAWNGRNRNHDAFPPDYEIVVGECRWRAAQLAGLTHIPGFWRDLDDKSMLEIQVIENLQRRDVSELEEADGYQMLMQRHAYTAEQIAEKIGKSKGYVYARLKLTALCAAGQDAFYAGKLDASTALLVARIRSVQLQTKAVKDITTGGYNGEPKSFRDAKWYIQNGFTVSLKQATFPLDDATLLAPTAGSCTDCPQRSGNAPEICADLDDVDVCTDVPCFDAKKLARRDQMIANAEKRKIPVLRGEGIKEAAPSGHIWSLDRERYQPLDEECEDDAEGRTYREILGDKAPVAALLEFGNSEANKQLVECAEPGALAKALKKAGWKPQEEEPPADETPEQKAEREAAEAERLAREKTHEEQRAAVDAEETRRKELLTEVVSSLQSLGSLADHLGIARQLIIAFIRNHFSDYDPETTLMAEDFGYQELEDENADFEVVCQHAMAAVEAWDLATLLAFTAAMLGHEDARPNRDWQPGQKAELLDPLAELLGLATPTQAAQAQGDSAPKGKKAKAKTKTAAATPPNEPAAPAEPGSTMRPAWPFPTGARK